jgi:hypothetical protein
VVGGPAVVIIWPFPSVLRFSLQFAVCSFCSSCPSPDLAPSVVQRFFLALLRYFGTSRTSNPLILQTRRRHNAHSSRAQQTLNRSHSSFILFAVSSAPFPPALGTQLTCGRPADVFSSLTAFCQQLRQSWCHCAWRGVEMLCASSSPSFEGLKGSRRLSGSF